MGGGKNTYGDYSQVFAISMVISEAARFGATLAAGGEG